MAVAARVCRPHDAAFADAALGAARKAFAWATAHPGVLFSNPPGVNTGAYGDRDCGDEVLWAAAELWRTAGGGDPRGGPRRGRRGRRPLRRERPPGEPHHAPAKMYLDEEASYATNEIAINWNAPLVFLLAGVGPAAR